MLRRLDIGLSKIRYASNLNRSSYKLTNIRFIGTEILHRNVDDILKDVKDAIDQNMVMPTNDVIAIAGILASNGYFKTALDSIQLCNPQDIVRPVSIRSLIGNVILKYFGKASPAPDKCFQHVSISLDLLLMLRLKHGEYI